jgi:FtsH-binding integral membrane protein
MRIFLIYIFLPVPTVLLSLSFCSALPPKGSVGSGSSSGSGGRTFIKPQPRDQRLSSSGSVNDEGRGRRRSFQSSVPNSLKNRRSHSSAFSSSEDGSSSELSETAITSSEEMIEEFLTRGERVTFITRVYSILTAQLLFTLYGIQLMRKHMNLVNWFLFSEKGRASMIATVISGTVFVLGMSHSEHLRHGNPQKWIILTLFTLGETLTTSVIAAMYNAEVVMKAITITAGSVTGITLWTALNRNPKYDLSAFGQGLAGITLSFLFIQLLRGLSIFFPAFAPSFLTSSSSSSSRRETFISMFVAGLFSLYLFFHTRLVFTNKHSKYELRPKDYVFAAMILYEDIIGIFLQLLRILGEQQERK